MSRKVYVPLTGGLGNQLFQLAAGMNKGDDVYLIHCLGKPRGNSSQPDLLEFNLPNYVKELKCNKGHYWVSRVYNFTISLSSSRKWMGRCSAIRLIIAIFASIAFSVHFRNPMRTYFTNEIGYDPSFSKSKGNFLIGYFQSWRYFDDAKVLSELRSIQLGKNHGEFYEKWNPEPTKRILGIHVRLGDYRNEKSFGILDHEYFSKAYDLLCLEHEYEEVWLFSDEPEAAIKLIPNIATTVKVLPSEGITPAQTLDLLRNCAGLVISNSTFSWWGAMISRRENVRVVAPKPWFLEAAEPTEIIPHEWKRINR